MDQEGEQGYVPGTIERHHMAGLSPNLSSFLFYQVHPPDASILWNTKKILLTNRNKFLMVQIRSHDKTVGETFLTRHSNVYVLTCTLGVLTENNCGLCTFLSDCASQFWGRCLWPVSWHHCSGQDWNTMCNRCPHRFC